MADVVVVGAGLAGLVTAVEAARAGRKVVLLDQEGPQSLGGQAFWSFGGLFLVDSPEQRRLKIRDSAELAWQDWQGTAGFDRPEDHWPSVWARDYVEFASGPKREWLHKLGVRFFPVVGWAERGGGLASGPGNSVPRFHLTWGTGPGLLEPFLQALKELPIEVRTRHRVEGLSTKGGQLVGVHGSVLEPTTAPRGVKSSRQVVGSFEMDAQLVVMASGGIGANLELVRKYWPARLGSPPRQMICGVPDFVDGRMLEVAENAGANLIHRDRMWHYTEGVQNWSPIWTDHGIRILPGPSGLWLDATGKRLPAPLFPGFDTLGTLQHLRTTGYDYSWLLLTQKMLEKEVALSGSEQNPDLTGKSWLKVLSRVLPGAPPPVEAFKQKGVDFVVRPSLVELVAAMNDLTGQALLNPDSVRDLIEARDRDLDNGLGKDLQVRCLRAARAYLGDRLIRTAAPHRILDPRCGPLIAIRLHILTRKTLGGLETDRECRVLRPDGSVFPNLLAVGEAAGFGGGGMHGYRSLEGTFLGGCLFSGRRAAALA